MIVKTFEKVTKVCKLCDNQYIDNTIKVFNPLGYTPGLCSVCNAEMLANLLVKGYPILKNVYTNQLFRQ